MSIINTTATFGKINNSAEVAELLNLSITSIESINQNLDDLFLVVCGVLTLLMQVGFACLESGSVTSKNVTNVMLKNFLDSLICSIVFWLTGWSLAFGNGNQFLGWTMWAGIDIPDRYLSLWFYQYAFASTASTILSGAVAERCSFVSYLSACSLLSGIIYPIVVHWTWTDEGWLYKLGFEDFSGGMIVHGLSGTVCLLATWIIGPRKYRFDLEHKEATKGHSKALIGIGSIIILVGFCGFNAGTINHYSKFGDGVVLAKIVRNTVIGGAGGALTVLFAGKCGMFKKESRWPFTFTVNGGIAGLVSSCATCNVFTYLESVISGIISGCIYMGLHHLIIKMRIDDPLDSSPIHLGSGVWSVLSIPLIRNGGIITQPIINTLQGLLIQVVGVLSIMCWVGICSLLLFGILHKFGLFRTSDEEEAIGMDVLKHREPAYSYHITIPSRQKEDVCD